MGQTPQPDQVVVIDASDNDQTKMVVSQFPSVEYIYNPSGRGNTPNSRNAGLRVAKGEIIVFLDDDAFAHPGWLKNLLATYDEPNVGAVAGRALDLKPGEDQRGLDEIGKVMPNGRITGFFAADPGGYVEVDHMLGANMSFRRDVMAQLGGFRDDTPGGSSIVCEETEMCLRVKQVGYRILFNPKSVVDHIPGPLFAGRRLDYRWEFNKCRNQPVMFIRIYGFGPLVFKYAFYIFGKTFWDFGRRIFEAFRYLSYCVAGSVIGFFVGTVYLLKERRNPIRNTPGGEEIRKLLSAAPVTSPPVPSDGNAE